MKNYGEALKENRLIRNLTLIDIEKKTGINNGSLSRWERNAVLPSIDACIKLANFYGISIEELLGINDDLGEMIVAPMGDSLTSDERKLIEDYRVLNSASKKLVKQTVETLRATAAQSGKRESN